METIGTDELAATGQTEEINVYGDRTVTGKKKKGRTSKEPGLGDTREKNDLDDNDLPSDSDSSDLEGGASKDRESNELTPTELVWQFVDDPSSSTGAQIFAIVIMLLIGVSVIAFIVESMPVFAQNKEADPVFSVIETVCVIAFTIEFVTRFASCPNKIKFARGMLNIVDFVAIVPFYIEVFAGSEAAGSSTLLRVVRLVRVFRVFKISRYVSWVKVFGKAMMHSAQPLAMLIFVMMIGVIVFSAAMFYIERGEYDSVRDAFIRPDGSISPFSSIPATFWWCIITMTTVGYGDVYPVTFGGRIVAAITSIAGVLVLAIPITIISTNFNEQYDKMRKSRNKMRARMVMLRNQFKAKRTGLDAMEDEIEELVRRNTAEFRKEVEDIFDLAAAELREELKAVVALAFKQRRKQYLESLEKPDPNQPPAAARIGAATVAPISRGSRTDQLAGELRN